MKKNIKINEYNFEFNYPNLNSATTVDILNEWNQLIQKQETKKDEWTTLDILPQYSFKNLKIVSNNIVSDSADSNDATELTITLKYDEYDRNNN